MALHPVDPVGMLSADAVLEASHHTVTLVTHGDGFLVQCTCTVEPLHTEWAKGWGTPRPEVALIRQARHRAQRAAWAHAEQAHDGDVTREGWV